MLILTVPLLPAAALLATAMLAFSATALRVADAEHSLGLLASSGVPEMASLASAGMKEKSLLLAPDPGEGELKRSLAEVGDWRRSERVGKRNEKHYNIVFYLFHVGLGLGLEIV